MSNKKIVQTKIIYPKKNEYNTLEEANCHPQNDILPYMIFPKYIDKE